MGGFKAKLICPVWVTLEQIDSAGTVVDDDAREPIKQAARTSTFRIKAQISYSRTVGDHRTQGGQGGEDDDASGHLVFLTKHLTNGSYTLVKGDRILIIAGKTVEHYLSTMQRAGHNDGTPGLEIWNFTDHNPLTN